MKKLTALLLAFMLLLACPAALTEGSDNWLDTVLGGVLDSVHSGEPLDLSGIELPEVADKAEKAKKEKRYLATLLIEGELVEGDYYYDHAGTLEVLSELTRDDENVALLMLFNTPGGSLYESDELYHAVMTYKEKTGRPVYAYMKQECCSGGVYAAMAADTIMAARMTITGSVGVYMSSYSEAGFYEKLGIEQEYIATGENKVPGYPTLTESQRAIDQALVDEGFGFFKEVIAQSRGLSEEEMAPFLDGRILSALQAKEMGLIDEVLYYDQALEKILAQLGEGVEEKDVTPEWDYGFEDAYDYNFLDWILP